MKITSGHGLVGPHQHDRFSRIDDHCRHVVQHVEDRYRKESLVARRVQHHWSFREAEPVVTVIDSCLRCDHRGVAGVDQAGKTEGAGTVVIKPGLHHLDLLLVGVFLDVILDAVQGMGFEAEEKR